MLLITLANRIIFLQIFMNCFGSFFIQIVIQENGNRKEKWQNKKKKAFVDQPPRASPLAQLPLSRPRASRPAQLPAQRSNSPRDPLSLTVTPGPRVSALVSNRSDSPVRALDVRAHVPTPPEP